MLTQDEFAARYNGRLLVIASRASVARWPNSISPVHPGLVKYRRLLLEVLGVSFVLQLFALITPLFFQVVMDKVLVHRGFTTLDVIAIGLLVVSIFDVGLSGLRNYVFSHTTSRIDVELGARLFRHLLNLAAGLFRCSSLVTPWPGCASWKTHSQFPHRPGVNLCAGSVFLICFYRRHAVLQRLADTVVIVSLPCYAIWSASITPVLRARLDGGSPVAPTTSHFWLSRSAASARSKRWRSSQVLAVLAR